jgi:hypothetical protein
MLIPTSRVEATIQTGTNIGDKQLFPTLTLTMQTVEILKCWFSFSINKAHYMRRL